MLSPRRYPAQMGRARLEAFSDGVFAIIITIMVLEMKIPHEPTFTALLERWPIFLSYVLSFIYVGIYWNNHHHLLHSVHQVTRGMLWANLHMLFWVSLIPFVTDWLGETHAAHAPVALYGVDMLLCGISYQVLQTVIERQQTEEVGKRAHHRSAIKVRLSLVFYAVSVAVSFVAPAISIGLFVFVALLWLVPDIRFEQIS